MAEGRMLRRKIAYNKAFARLSSDRARLLFVLLLAHLDAEGRLTADPELVKAKVVPLIELHTVETITADLRELAAAGLIHVYEASGEPWLCFPKFHDNQKIRRNADGLPSHEAASIIPPPPENYRATLSDAGSPTAQVQVKLSSSSSKEKPTSLTRRPARFSDGDLSLATRLRDRIVGNKPDAKVTQTLDAWAETFRLMREQDGRTPERVSAVIDWCQRDPFWRSNILSADKLREKFDQLELRMLDNGGVGDGSGRAETTRGNNGAHPANEDKYAKSRDRMRKQLGGGGGD